MRGVNWIVLGLVTLVAVGCQSLCPREEKAKDTGRPNRQSMLFEASYGERVPGTNREVGLWWASSGWKVSRTRPIPKAKGKGVVIQAARNEAEAAQLVIRPKSGLSGFFAQAGSLTGPSGAAIPASNVEVLRVRYVEVKQQTDRTGAVGFWPDPLPPFKGPIELDAGQNQPLWVRVTVPRRIPAGEYKGVIHLTAVDYEQEVPLRVTVFDFDLPDRMTCTTAFGFSPGNVYRYQNLTDPAQQRTVLDKYWSSFSAHHISPYHPAPLDPIQVTWPEDASSEIAFDWTAWDEAMTRAIDDYGFNSFRLSIPGMGGGTFHSRTEPSLRGYAEDTPEYASLFSAYCAAVQEHLREKGWLDEAYVYWFDEPAPKDYEFVKNGFRKLKEHAPDIRRMLTEQVEPALVGAPDIWCPVTPSYDHEDAEARRAQGESFWWYVCTGPKAPYCTLFIDHAATELRVWLWQTWQRNIDGILVWQTNYWTSSAAYPDEPQNPYADPMGWTSGYSTAKGTRKPWGNGDGRFIYPPEAAADGRPGKPILEGPVDTIRWEMLRDGIEDYEYLTMLKQLLQSKESALGGRRGEFEALLEIPKAVTVDMKRFTKDPAPIEAHREAVARAIEALYGR